MNPKRVEQCKKSIAKVMGVHRSYNFSQPYINEEEQQFGGTAFFVDPKLFGKKFPVEKRCRYALTNFHVVDQLIHKQCNIYFPRKGRSSIKAKVLFVVNALDVAILEIDPEGEHDQWYEGGDVTEFINGIPNLQCETKDPIKGNAQQVIGIGFPNLSNDYQICPGCVSGRGLGMIQVSISLNGGNSGGPLLMNGKVIGICTASISDSEGLGLAVPIYQIIRFLSHWTDYDKILLTTPSWGLDLTTLTDDYVAYHNISDGVQGGLVTKVVETGCLHEVGIKANDIIVGINSGGRRYNVDNTGHVLVPWTDKKVPLGNQEFILSLDKDDVTLHVCKARGRKNYKVTEIQVTPVPIKFEIREKFHCWEDIDYCVVGSCVFMELTTNHLEADEDEEMEMYCPASRAIPLVQFISGTMHMKKIVVCTHIPLESHVDWNSHLKIYEQILEVNGKKITDLNKFNSVIQEAADAFNEAGNDNLEHDKRNFLVIKTTKEKTYLDIRKLIVGEIRDREKAQYPVEKAVLLNAIAQQSSRKRQRRR